MPALPPKADRQGSHTGRFAYSWMSAVSSAAFERTVGTVSTRKQDKVNR